MLDFIFVPAVVGIVTLGIYKIFELFAKRKERMLIIEKLGQSLDANDFPMNTLLPEKQAKSYMALKAACLLLGLGLGLMIGFFISSSWASDMIFSERHIGYQARETLSVIYGASVLLFGGLGLLVSFFLEQRYDRKLKNQQ